MPLQWMLRSLKETASGFQPSAVRLLAPLASSEHVDGTGVRISHLRCAPALMRTQLILPPHGVPSSLKLGGRWLNLSSNV